MTVRIQANHRFDSNPSADLAQSGGLGEVKRSRGSLDDAPRLRDYCVHHMPFYEKLREVRVQPV